MMLSRLVQDCDYYLGNGNRYGKNLWAGNVDGHIEEMKRRWNNLPENAKPEWLSMEDILVYEKKMKNEYADGGFMNNVYKKGGSIPSEIVAHTENDSIWFYQSVGTKNFHTSLWKKQDGKFETNSGYENKTFDKKEDAIEHAKNGLKRQIEEYIERPNSLKDYVGKHFVNAHVFYYIGGLRKIASKSSAWSDRKKKMVSLDGQYKPDFIVLRMEVNNKLAPYDEKQSSKETTLDFVDLDTMKRWTKNNNLKTIKLPSKLQEKVDSHKKYFDRFEGKKLEDGGETEDVDYLTSEDFQKIHENLEKEDLEKHRKLGTHKKFTDWWYSGGREIAIKKYGDDEEISWSESYEDFKDGKFENGGETEQGVDLFEDYDNIPDNLQKILDKYEDAFQDGDYAGLAKALKEANAIGYTFEYYLDGQAYDLRKIGEKGKSEVEEYADGGQVRVGDKFKYDWTDGRTGGVKGYNVVEIIKSNVTSSKDYKTKVMVVKVVESSDPSQVGRLDEEYKPSFKKAIKRGMYEPLQERKRKMVDEFYAKGGKVKDKNGFNLYNKLNDKKNKDFWVWEYKKPSDVIEDKTDAKMFEDYTEKLIVDYLNSRKARGYNYAFHIQGKNGDDFNFVSQTWEDVWDKYDNDDYEDIDDEENEDDNYAKGGDLIKTPFGHGEFLWFFNWKDGGFNEVYAETKAQAIKKATQDGYPTYMPDNQYAKRSLQDVQDQFGKEAVDYIRSKSTWSNKDQKSYSNKDLKLTDVGFSSGLVPDEKTFRKQTHDDSRETTRMANMMTMAKGGTTDGGSTKEYADKKYILKADIKTVTVKRNGKEVTYKGADVLNGANVLAKGGDISSKANYIPKRDVVEVELNDGSKIKPVNGYWVKKGAEPITSKQEFTYKDLPKDGSEIKITAPKLGYFPEIDLILKYNSKNFRFDIYEDGVKKDVVGEKEVLNNLNSGIYVFTDKSTPTSSGKSEPKIGTTQIRKDMRGSWKAETNVDNFNGYDWRISTVKTYSGNLVSSAQGGKTEATGTKGIVMFKYTIYQDPNHTLEVSKPKRLTDKVVTEQHDKALAKFKKFMETGMFKGGGKISNFDKLSAKVAKEYEGKPVKSQYQEEYGQYYSKEEAQEVGDKVAGKMKAMTADKKAFGGLFGSAKSMMTIPKYPDLDDKQVALKSGKFVQVFSQLDNKLSVLDVGRIGSGERPYTVDISEVDMNSFKAGGKTETKKTNSGTEMLKQANELAKKIRKDGESWLDAKKRAFAQLKK